MGTKRVVWVFVLAVGLAVAAVAFARISTVIPSVTTRATSNGTNNPKSSALAEPSPLVHVAAEIVTVTPRGFEPYVITRPARPFILAVENRSGLQSITLRLYKTLTGVPGTTLVPPPLFEIALGREQLDWNDLEILPPGQYALVEANHPAWAYNITINSQL